MEKSTNFEMFVEAKHYIDKHHADNPIFFLVPAFWRLEVTRWGLGMVPLVSLKEVLNENYLR